MTFSYPINCAIKDVSLISILQIDFVNIIYNVVASSLIKYSNIEVLKSLNEVNF